MPQLKLNYLLSIAVEDVEALRLTETLRPILPSYHNIVGFRRLVVGVGVEFTGDLSHHFQRGFPSQQMMRFVRELHKAWPYSGVYIGCIEWFSLLYLSHAKSAQVVYRAGEDHSLVCINPKDAALLQPSLAEGISTITRQFKLRAAEKTALLYRLTHITEWVSTSAPMSIPP